MKSQTISKQNKLQDILNFDVCRSLVDKAKANNETYVILIPHYSINIASKYEDCEALQWDLDELGDYIGEYVSVSDYDDLVVDMTTED